MDAKAVVKFSGNRLFTDTKPSPQRLLIHCIGEKKYLHNEEM